MERFWSKVDKNGPGGCWLWMAAHFRSGYGAFGWRDGPGSTKSKTWRAHRVAWVLTHGDIPDGMHVLHTCDTTDCVNPAHLWLGTHDDNMSDRWKKGGYGYRGGDEYEAPVFKKKIRRA